MSDRSDGKIDRKPWDGSWRVSASRSKSKKPVRETQSGGRNTQSNPKKRKGTCPVCRRKEADLDFHHWDYKKDLGCHICNDCHFYGHSGENCRPSETVGDEWVPRFFSRLMIIYRRNHSWLSQDRIFKQLSVPQKHRKELAKYISGGGSDD